MISSSIQSFWRKSWSVRVLTARFKTRQWLAKLSYLPVFVRVRLSAEDDFKFRWSYIVPFHDPHRSFFEYWGHDLPELRLLRKILKPGMVFMDVGAYHGIYSLIAGRSLGSTGQIIAFEPSPRERRRLALHLQWNGVRIARIESYAVSSGKSESPFFQVVSGDKTRNGLRPPASADIVRELPVKTISLDQYVLDRSLSRVDVIKLDVEGAELNAFQGATRVLTELRPIFLCEVLDAAAQAWGYQAKQTIALLQNHGYRWFEILSDGTIAPHEPRESYPEVRNYLAIPQERSITGIEADLR